MQQQTGMPFIIMQQLQPGIIMQDMQSQQHWIIFSIILSPLVQVIMHPISIISILHMPIMPMLHMHMHMPFIMQQQETDPPAIIMQRFFIISALVLSSAVQVIFMPPAHFSIFMVQRGAMPIMPLFIIMGFIMGMPIPMPGIIPPIMPGIIWGIILGIMPFIIGIWPIIPPIPIIPRSVVIEFMAAPLISEVR
jgi:hypothetical protein